MGMAETAKQIMWEIFQQCHNAVCLAATTYALAPVVAARHGTAVTGSFGVQGRT